MKKAFIFLLIVFLANVLSMYYGWYLKWDWTDIIAHFSGGLFMAMFMAAYLKDQLPPGKIIKNALIIVGVAVFIGVIWEFAEFIANQTLIVPTRKYLGVNAYFMGDLVDTVKDLLMDTLGALTFFIIHSLRSRNSH